MRKLSVLLVSLLMAWAAFAFWRAHSILQTPADFRQIAYVGSQSCQSCHQDNHASWYKTYHRTMTQDANEQSVQGHFDGKELNAFGALLKPVKNGRQFEFQYTVPDGSTLSLPIARTVGSHRYQQYLAKPYEDQTHYRLHYLWHNEEQRWVHMNAVFLGSDQQDFDAQVSPWNNNCVFCHNTGVQPKISNLTEFRERARRGEAVDVQRDLRFATEVAELGISCEACHGPAQQHVAHMAKFATRLLAQIGVPDKAIVNPEHMSAARSTDVCGSCHGNRTLKSAEQLDALYNTGLSYRPGDVLTDHVVPLQKDTPSPSARLPDLFRQRFWADGSVRLSAYEYQGHNASMCAQKSDLTCINCHEMHGGDPAGMLPERAKTAEGSDAQCLRCHSELRNKIAEHSGHKQDSSGARCINCHMPKQVYGVMTIHRTHEIQVPDVLHDLAVGRPNACLNCHAEQSGNWIQARGDSGHTNAANAPMTAPILRADGADPQLADGLVALIAGDPVRQAVAAYAMGEFVNELSDAALRVRVPWLLAGMADDRPAIRRFAWRSLRAIAQELEKRGHGLGLSLEQFDYTAANADRAAALAIWQQQFAVLDKSTWAAPSAGQGLNADYTLQAEILAQLQKLSERSDYQIDIGE